MSFGLTLSLLLQPVPADATAFAWFGGDWHCYEVPPARSGPRSQEEYWVMDRRGGWVGVGRTIWSSTRALEHLRIARDAAGRWTYYASPNGAAPVAFPLVRVTRNEAVFENAANGYPQRIHYRHEPNRLIATISMIDGSRPHVWRFTNLRGTDERRAPCRTREEMN